MKFGVTSAILAACCLWMLALPACSLRGGGAGPKPVASAPPPSPPAKPPVESAADLPVSVPQTQVTLPSPQPIQAEALAVVKVEPPPTAPASQTAKPRPAAPRTEPRQQTAVQAPAGPQPPPAASRRRIRPVESPEERNRLLAEIATSQRQVHDNLAKAKTRPLTEAEKSAVERIVAFLEQADTATKDQDLQQAAALSNRALVLSQDLNSEKLK